MTSSPTAKFFAKKWLDEQPMSAEQAVDSGKEPPLLLRPISSSSLTAQGAEATCDHGREVKIRANIYKVNRIDPAAGFFEAEGFIELDWELNVGEVREARKDDLTPQGLEELFDQESAEYAVKPWHLWNPRPYFYNSVGVFAKLKVSHRVEKCVDRTRQWWKVTRHDEFVGRFQVELDEKEDDVAYPLKEVGLDIVVCSYRDTTLLKQFTVARSTDKMPQPWGVLNPKRFHRQQPAWFLAKPNSHKTLNRKTTYAPPEAYHLSIASAEEEGSWEDKEIERGTDKALHYLTVSTNSTSKARSSTCKQYPLLRIRMTAVRDITCTTLLGPVPIPTHSCVRAYCRCMFPMSTTTVRRKELKKSAR